jgi:hypothetical protein
MKKNIIFIFGSCESRNSNEKNTIKIINQRILIFSLNFGMDY